ncbi:MAG: hypothetical protein GY850_33850, partial [bacterium]|nr:hypothetical protein [bacterium]
SGKGGAAELLDIHPNTLYYRMKKVGIDRNLHKQHSAIQNKLGT